MAVKPVQPENKTTLSANPTPPRGGNRQPGRRAQRPARQGRAEETVRLAHPGDAHDAVPAAATPAGALQFQIQYRIVHEIGRGGMSTVYLAADERLGRCVALKRLGEKFLAQVQMKERFFREARAIASLNHLHIVHVYGIEADEKGPFIVMEYVPGPGKAASPDLPPPPLSLEQKVDKLEGPMPPRLAVEMVRKLCRAVQYAHDRGVIHRDLKPSNVLLDESGEPKIVDFGLARIADAGEVTLTLAGSKMLSLGYGAPEQEMDTATVDERADIYGLGAILYFCLTGENPRFFRESRIPVHLRPPLLKALEKDREARWRTARDFEEALFQSGGPYVVSKTEAGMWRCKWCSALNTLEGRYCAECGWDGIEKCPECGGETRVGVRFCSVCGTDIKAFEDMQGLLARLKQYREEKKFDRMDPDADAAGQFQARGEAGRALLRQIAELQETARWAQARKEELRQVISTGLERENYEQVRERVSEYDVLDGGDLYRDLRVQLPWKMAERDVHSLKAGVEEARRLFEQKKLRASRQLLEDVRHRRARIINLEIQFPVLKGRLGAGGLSERPEDELARTLRSVDGDIASLELELSNAEKRLAELVQETEPALRSQDYDLCLAKGTEIRQLTADPTEADEGLGKAAALVAQIASSLKRAEEALSCGRFDAAERICRRVLDRLKPDSAETHRMLVRIAWKRRRRRFWTTLGAAACAAAVYGMSICPVYKAVAGHDQAPFANTLNAFYTPVFWLHENSLLRQPLEWYARWWGIDVFGRSERRPPPERINAPSRAS